MNNEQREALNNLADAFRKANDIGALDVLQGFVEFPDSINDCVDAIVELLLTKEV